MDEKIKALEELITSLKKRLDEEIEFSAKHLKDIEKRLDNIELEIDQLI